MFDIHDARTVRVPQAPPARRGTGFGTALGLAAGWVIAPIVLLVAYVGPPSSYVAGLLIGRGLFITFLAAAVTWLVARKPGWRTGSLIALSGAIVLVTFVLLVPSGIR